MEAIWSGGGGGGKADLGNQIDMSDKNDPWVKGTDITDRVHTDEEAENSTSATRECEPHSCSESRPVSF